MKINNSNMFFMQAYLSKSTRPLSQNVRLMAMLDETEKHSFQKQNHFAC